MCWWALRQLPKILKLVSPFLKALATISCTNNVKLISVTMEMSIKHYHIQWRQQECIFNLEGQRLLCKEEQWAILVNLLFYIQGSFIRTTHCVHNLPQASYQPSPVLEILISYVHFTLHPSFHPAIMPPAIKSHQNSNFTFSQAGFSHFLPWKAWIIPLSPWLLHSVHESENNGLDVMRSQHFISPRPHR